MRNEHVDVAVEELATIEHEAGWTRVESIASVFARHFFRGSEEAIGSELKLRNASIRTIARHPRCPLSKSQLHSILLAHVVHRSEPLVRQSSFLTPSHVAAVAGLPKQSRAALLKRAERERLSVRDVLANVRQMRRQEGERRGRPPTSSGQKAVTRLENTLLNLEESISLIRSSSVSRETREKLWGLLKQLSTLHAEACRAVEDSSVLSFRALPRKASQALTREAS